MCCVCNGVCMHVGEHDYCAAHKPNVTPPFTFIQPTQYGWTCPRCGRTNAPWVAQCCPPLIQVGVDT